MCDITVLLPESLFALFAVHRSIPCHSPAVPAASGEVARGRVRIWGVWDLGGRRLHPGWVPAWGLYLRGCLSLISSLPLSSYAFVLLEDSSFFLEG